MKVAGELVFKKRLPSIVSLIRKWEVGRAKLDRPKLERVAKCKGKTLEGVENDGVVRLSKNQNKGPSMNLCKKVMQEGCRG